MMASPELIPAGSGDAAAFEEAFPLLGVGMHQQPYAGVPAVFTDRQRGEVAREQADFALTDPYGGMTMIRRSLGQHDLGRLDQPPLWTIDSFNGSH